MEQFSHIDEAGNARMVDVGQKEITAREAVAVGRIYMSDTCFSMVQAGTMKKAMYLRWPRLPASWVQKERVISFPCAISWH